MLRQRRVCALAAVVAGLLAGSAVLPALAQDATQAPAAQAPAAQAPAADVPVAAAPSLPEPSPEQLTIALQFLKASGLTTGFDDIIPQYMTQASQIYINQRPELRAMINDAAIALVPEFVAKRSELDKNLARFYTTKFTEDELKQLVAFYQTPVGVKFSKEQQDILRDSIPVVQNWTRELQYSILQRMKAEVEKRGGKLGPSAPDEPAGAAPAPATTP